MIPLEQQRTLRDTFAQTLTGRVKVEYFTQQPSTLMVPGREPCLYCHEVQVLLEEITHLSPLLSLDVHEFGVDRALERRRGVEHVPATILRGVVNRPATFYGAPVGLLLSPLVEAIVLMSRNEAELPARVSRRLQRLRESVRVSVYVTPDSEFCPPMVVWAFAFAVASKHVKVEVVEIGEFPQLIERYQIKQVPFTVINERVAFPGVVEPEVFAEQITRGAGTRAMSVQLPQSGGASRLQTQAQPQSQPQQTVRPSGLILPGR